MAAGLFNVFEEMKTILLGMEEIKVSSKICVHLRNDEFIYLCIRTLKLLLGLLKLCFPSKVCMYMIIKTCVCCFTMDHLCGCWVCSD